MWVRYMTMNMIKNLFYILMVMVGMTLPVGCIEDGISTSPSDQPAFSTDTLSLGTVFTGEGTPTSRFTVYNRHDKIINISDIRLRDDVGQMFRINVDGMSGETFSNIEVRPNDSIFVFVEATLPVNDADMPVEVRRHLDFTVNGVVSTVVISVEGQDVRRLRGETLTADTRLDAARPYQIFDSLVVAEGATLTLAPGTRLHFHDKAFLRVDGTLLSEGTADRQVELTGDRSGNVASTIPYEIMSGQWGGIVLSPASRANRMEYTSVRNSSFGIVVDSVAYSDGLPSLKMVNCQIRNTKGYVLESYHSSVTAVGCELADASSGILFLHGGTHIINHCTIANYYLFTALGGPAVVFSHVDDDTDDGSGLPRLSAEISNSIIYGNGTELSHGDLTGLPVTIVRTLMKSAGSDDDNFLECIWDEDPLYYTVRSDYFFDYRLKPESPAIAAADPAFTLPEAAVDRYGLPRGDAPDIGAYVYDPALAPEDGK